MHFEKLPRNMKSISVDPVASVVMVTYNHELYIKNAIEGVLSQEAEFPFELLISDDCSKDRTRQIVEDYQLKYPQVIRTLNSEENLGMHLNGLKLEQASRGHYIAYCEGDDFWHNRTKLQKQVKFLKDNPAYGMVHSNSRAYYVVKNKLIKNAIGSNRNLEDSQAFIEILTGKRIIWTLTTCIRRDLLHSVFKECPECTDTRWPMADTQRWLEISRRAKVKYFHEELATRTFLAESASNSNDPKKTLRFKLGGKELIEYYLEKYEVPNNIKDQIEARIVNAVMAAAFYAEDELCAERLYSEAIQRQLPVPFDFHLYAIGVRNPGLKGFMRYILNIIRFKRKAFNKVYRSLLSNG